ncbi:MAG: hypothetical protein EBS83_10200, partial [Planctomycetia bacterium]|nr:hypothetical protein [Planctomycetia bacterium]
EIYDRAAADPAAFWAERADALPWLKPYGRCLYLYADDAGVGDCHARLRPDWSRPLGDLWWLFQRGDC